MAGYIPPPMNPAQGATVGKVYTGTGVNQAGWGDKFTLAPAGRVAPAGSYADEGLGSLLDALGASGLDTSGLTGWGAFPLSASELWAGASWITYNPTTQAVVARGPLKPGDPIDDGDPNTTPGILTPAIIGMPYPAWNIAFLVKAYNIATPQTIYTAISGEVSNVNGRGTGMQTPGATDVRIANIEFRWKINSGPYTAFTPYWR